MDCEEAEPTDIGTYYVDPIENPDSYTTVDGTMAQYPLIESEYSKLGIEDKRSTECATPGGSTFPRDETYKNILTFARTMLERNREPALDSTKSVETPRCLSKLTTILNARPTTSQKGLKHQVLSWVI